MESSNVCCLISELAAVIRISGTIVLGNKEDVNIKIATENAAFARRVFSIIKKLFKIYPEVKTRKSIKLMKHTSYIIIITEALGAERVLEKIGIESDKLKLSEDGSIKMKDFKSIFKKPCCKKSYLRGAFLSGGAISNPEKTYHLEITNHSRLLAVEMSGLINSYGLNSRIIKRKSNYIVYLKEGENIVDFLNIIGAHKALLDLENVRIIKGMRNSVNRIVNCETANLDKTITASVRQVESIKYIKSNGGIDKLTKSLQDIAELRVLYSDVSLKELGEMLSPVLGKSGVNHRLKKLDEIAENLKIMKGE